MNQSLLRLTLLISELNKRFFFYSCWSRIVKRKFKRSIKTSESLYNKSYGEIKYALGATGETYISIREKGPESRTHVPLNILRR